MAKAFGLALELLQALSRKDVVETCRLVDELKVVMDTFKRSC